MKKFVCVPNKYQTIINDQQKKIINYSNFIDRKYFEEIVNNSIIYFTNEEQIIINGKIFYIPTYLYSFYFDINARHYIIMKKTNKEVFKLNITKIFLNQLLKQNINLTNKQIILKNMFIEYYSFILSEMPIQENQNIYIFSLFIQLFKNNGMNEEKIKEYIFKNEFSYLYEYILKLLNNDYEILNQILFCLNNIRIDLISKNNYEDFIKYFQHVIKNVVLDKNLNQNLLLGNILYTLNILIL